MEIGYTPVQETIMSDGIELTVNAFGNVPVVGSIVSNIYNGVQITSKFKNIVVGLSNLSEEKSLLAKRKLLSTYTQKILRLSQSFRNDIYTSEYTICCADFVLQIRFVYRRYSCFQKRYFMRNKY